MDICFDNCELIVTGGVTRKDLYLLILQCEQYYKTRTTLEKKLQSLFQFPDDKMQSYLSNLYATYSDVEDTTLEMICDYLNLHVDGLEHYIGDWDAPIHHSADKNFTPTQVQAFLSKMDNINLKLQSLLSLLTVIFHSIKTIDMEFTPEIFETYDTYSLYCYLINTSYNVMEYPLISFHD